jgi:hypothetical protein
MPEALKVVDIADFPALLKKAGFASQEEFNTLVCKADISDPDKRAAFRRWQIHDATKQGLEDLIRGVKTPITHPNHHVVGKLYGGYGFATEATEIYRCTAYDPDYDYKLESVTGPHDVRKVSPRAINATFWPADDHGDYWYVCQWGVRVPKVRLCDRTEDATAVQRVDPKGISLHLNEHGHVMACALCRGGTNKKQCQPGKCRRGSTPEQTIAALPQLKLYVAEF